MLEKLSRIAVIFIAIVLLTIICGCVWLFFALSDADEKFLIARGIITATPTHMSTPTKTPKPTSTPLPYSIIVHHSGADGQFQPSDCAPVYKSEYGKPDDCIPNGTVLKIYGAPSNSSQEFYYAIRWSIDHQLRFAGYIKRSDTLPLNEGEATPTPFPTGMWGINFGRSTFDDSQTVILTLRAMRPVEGWLAKETPILILRCLEGETEAYINVKMPQDVELGLHNKSTVRIRFDSEEAIKIVTNQSTDGKALFFPDPKPLIEKMLQHQKLVFGFTPFNAPPVETYFELRGLSEAIKPLQDVCK